MRFTSLLFLLVSFASIAAANAVDNDNDVCNATVDTSCAVQKRNVDSTLCDSNINGGKDGYLYRYGGTAQAYKPNAPVKSEVCSLTDVENRPYRTASSAFYRKRYSSAPKLSIKISTFLCSINTSNDCCCQPAGSGDSSTLSIEVWQTRPDGLYSSLRSGNDDGVCRATIETKNLSGSSIEFQTLAPGSTGSMNGIGPAGFDFGPYGPPVIHLLASTNTTTDTDMAIEPVLIDIPVLLDPKTLEQKQFRGRDWRGQAWVNRTTTLVQPYEITSWQSKIESNSVEIAIDLYLRQVESSGLNTESAVSSTPRSIEMCTSSLYVLPSSFFVEPLSLCGPSILDYFAI